MRIIQLSNNIISQTGGCLLAALEELLAHHARLRKVLNKRQREELGLENIKVVLSGDHRFWLYRQGLYAVVEDRWTGKQAQFRLEFKADRRARLEVNQIRRRLPEFYNHLDGYGLWESLDSGRPRCYLYRISFVLRFKQNVRWLGKNTQRREDYDDDYLCINHKDGCAENDHWTNLELLTYKEHGVVEVEKTNRELDAAYEELSDLGNVEEWELVEQEVEVGEEWWDDYMSQVHAA